MVLGYITSPTREAKYSITNYLLVLGLSLISTLG
jgi:hypothetical protein